MKMKISPESRLRVSRRLNSQLWRKQQKKKAKNYEWLKWQRHQSAGRLAFVVVSMLVKWNEHSLLYFILFVYKLFLLLCCCFYYHDYCFIYQSAWSVVRNVAICCSILLFILCVFVCSRTFQKADRCENERRRRRKEKISNM